MMFSAVAAVALATPTPARGATYTWDNGFGNLNWSNPNNWTGVPDNTEPTSADNAIFPTPIPAGGGTISPFLTEDALSVTFNDAYTLANTGSLRLGTGGQVTVASTKTAVINAALVGSNGLNKLGAGTLALTSGSSTFTNNIVISDGTLRVSNNTAMGATANTITIGNGATLATDQTFFTTGHSVILGTVIGGASTINPAAGTKLTLNAALTGSQVLVVNDAGTLELTAASTRPYSTLISQGTVLLSHGAGLGEGQISVDTAATLELASGITCDQSMSFLGGIVRTSASGSYTGTMVRNASPATATLDSGGSAANVFTVGNAANDYSGGFDSTITAIAGSGTVRLPFSNNYAGRWHVNSGTLRIDDAASLGSGTGATIVNAGTLALGSGVTLDRAMTLNSGATLQPVAGSTGSNGVMTVGSGASVTFNSNNNAANVLSIGNAANDLVGGSGGATINVTGLGTVELNQSNSYVGGWNVAGGAKLRLMNGTSLGTGTSAVVNSGTIELNGVSVNRAATMVTGGKLLAVGDSAWLGVLTMPAGAGGVNIDSGADATKIFTIGDGTNDVTGGGPNTVNINGLGTVRLPFANNYIGNWTIVSGTLRAEDGGALGSGNVTMSATGTLEIAGVTIGNQVALPNGATLRGTGAAGSVGSHPVGIGATVTLASGSNPSDVLSIGNAANDLNGGGGTATINVVGGGKVVLPFANNYSGGWFLDSGALEVPLDAALGNAANAITLSGGNLTASETFTTARTITGSGRISANATKTLTTTGAITAVTLFKSGAGTVVSTGAANSVTTLNLEAGVLRQTGGGMTVGTLEAGSSVGTVGTYNLTAGNLDASVAHIGKSGDGTFVQSGGTFTVGNTGNVLHHAESIGSTGSYTLSNGTLHVINNTVGTNGEAIGFNGTATFIQTGGTHLVNGTNGNLVIGYAATGVGSYTISGGTLTSNSLYLGRDAGAVGTLNVNGGTVNVPVEFLDLGLNIGATGTVNVNAGSITAQGIYVGGISTQPRGTGIMNVAGGLASTPNVFKIWNTTDTAVNLSGGKLSVGSLDTNTNPSRLNWTGGTLEFTASNPVIGAGAALGTSVTLSGSKVLRVTGTSNAVRVLASGTVNFSGGRVDLTTKKMIVTGGALGTAAGGTYSGLSGAVQSAHNAGAWDGPGVTTSMPDAVTGLTSIGIATADQTGYAGGTFGGVSVASGDVLMMYTYGGDANLDGFISGDDYAAIDFNIAVPGASGWYNGDFNYDGIISGDDYAAIDFNIVAQGAPFPTSGAVGGVVMVPEPVGLALGFLAVVASTPRRRRQRIT